MPGTMTMEELLEKETIKELRIAYSHCFDGRDLDGLVDLFTDDAVCEFGPEFGGDWVGKEQIRTNFSGYLNSDDTLYTVLHAVTNPWIRLINESTANGRWYLQDIYTSAEQSQPVGLLGIYDDVYKKMDGVWKIHRTRIDFLWPNRHFTGTRDLQELESY